ncbi:MAG: hypothetical protein ACRD96_22320 [Bryobacteraceae bacterium]
MRLLIRIVVRTVVPLAALYAAFCAVLFVAMWRGADAISLVMAKAPRFALRALPFRPLWMVAREGNLKPGDAAPDFSLLTLDRGGRVRLSSFRGDRPVVLVFGSYT